MSSTDYNPHHEPFQYYASTANPHHLPPASAAEIGHDGQANHQYDMSSFDQVVGTDNLPAVSFLKAPNYQDGHAGYSDPLDEQHFIVKEINAIQKSKHWKDTAIVLAYDDSDGWFVEPTVIETKNPDFRTMREELFGPVVTTYVYDENEWDDTLRLIDRTAPYGLTGAVFSEDRAAIDDAKQKLRYAAGNFYVNDKPTGAVVGQQPFGGARASGTNDKAGSMWNLIRWVSPRSIKETFTPPRDYRYPFMDDGADSAGT